MSRNSAREDAERELRRAQVAALLLSRRTYRQIADSVGCGIATVHRDVERIKASWREQAGREYADVVAEEAAKLDAIEHGLMPRAQLGDPAAVSAFVRLAQRRARLMGLDKPLKVEASLPPELIAEIISTVIDRVLAEIGVETTPEIDAVVARQLVLVADERGADAA